MSDRSESGGYVRRGHAAIGNQHRAGDLGSIVGR
jgi:hypothetical protein